MVLPRFDRAHDNEVGAIQDGRLRLLNRFVSANERRQDRRHRQLPLGGEGGQLIQRGLGVTTMPAALCNAKTIRCSCFAASPALQYSGSSRKSGHK